jgi:transposase
MRGLLVYLNTQHHLPYKRLCDLVFDLFGACPCEGTLFTSLSTAYDALAPVEAGIKEAIRRSPVVGFDETGCRIENKLHWLHTATTNRLTVYLSHEKRGRKAMEAFCVLPGFQGVAVHDAFSPYFGYNHCEHALCNAHLLRELLFVQGQPLQPWSSGMIHLLLEIKQAVDAAREEGRTQLSTEIREAFRRRYDRLLTDGMGRNLPNERTGTRGQARQSTAYNLLKRLQKHKDSVLRFMDRFDVPFDNNFSERALRMMKVKQKVSGSFRSQLGADFFCRIRGYIATLRLQQQPLLPALQSLFLQQPIMPLLTG